MGNRIKYIFLLLAIPLQFAAAEYMVSITTNACGNTQTYTIQDGEQMVLHAHPIAGYAFSQWSDGNTDNPRIVTITGDVSYTAEFVAMSPMPTIYKVAVSADGCASKEFQVVEGNVIKIYPHAKASYVFSKWSDGNTDNPRIALINSDTSFVAQFVDSLESIYTFIVNAEGCVAELSRNFALGTKVKLYAHADECFEFSRWSDGNTDNPRIVTINDNAKYTAEFRNIAEKEFTKAFTVSEDKKVIFSTGNLQYRASDGRWRFAENQYDMIGAANENISSTYEGWIDLFGWGTSGYHNESDEFNTQYQPYSTSKSDVDLTNNRYGYGPSLNQTDENLVESSANYDWGIYNAICNGGGKTNQWRTLTQDQWLYLINSRANAAEKWFRGSVNGVNGIILLPDEYMETTIPYTTGVTNFTTNSFSPNEWDIMEQEGAVFLPAAGSRSGTTYTAGTASYHSTTARDSARNYIAHFTDVNTSYSYVGPRYVGRAVRLVKDVEEKFTITTSGENGTITGGGTYNSGSNTTLIATPDECYQFVQWSDGNADNPRTVTVNGNATYTAIFKAEQYTISAESADEIQGSVSIEINQ